MRLVLGFLLGAAIGLAVAMVLGARDTVVEQATWTGDDATPPPIPRDDGMPGDMRPAGT